MAPVIRLKLTNLGLLRHVENALEKSRQMLGRPLTADEEYSTIVGYLECFHDFVKAKKRNEG